MQVLFQDDEIAEIRRVAKRQRMTVAEWLRLALRRARRDEPVRDPKRKLAILREAAKVNAPTADINQMLAEIERGYLGSGARGVRG